MSGLCAIVTRDGGPSDPADVRRLCAAAPHRGTRMHAVPGDGAATLAVQTAAPLPGRRAADATAVACVDGLTIAFHGRIDNLAELRAALAVSRPDPLDDGGPQATARVVVRAFAHWHEGCAARLLGDFAFVIRDTVRRRTYCARDAIGVKPFYYHAGPARFVAASELTQVMAAGVPVVPNESMVAELLAFDVCSRSDTLYRDIVRLPPGHWMIVTDRDVHVARYWTPEGTTELCYGRDEDYAAQCFEVFQRAVADRTDAHTPAAAYLSGGLDSSSVVCMAHALERPFETFSMVFPDVPEADESPFIDAVVDRLGRPSHRLIAPALDAVRYRRAAAGRADLPDLPGDALGQPLLEAMQARGLHVALTGAGGDYGFTGSFTHYAELLQQRDLRGLLRRMRSDRQTADAGWSPFAFLTSGVRLMMPPAMRRALRPLARYAGLGVQVPPWMTPALAARTNLRDRLSAARTTCTGGPPTRQAVCELFESGWTARVLESGDRTAAEHGIELRHPFFDRRLVEFAIALPESQRWRGSTTKYVLRQAMRGLLPESVYARNGKADASPYVVRLVEALGGAAALRDLHIEAQGWVAGRAVQAEYVRASRQWHRGDPGYCDGMFNVWMTLAIETWYRAMFVEGTAHGRDTERRSRPAGHASGRHAGAVSAGTVSLAGAR